MSRTRKSDTLRTCPKCLAYIFPGEIRCGCAGKKLHFPTKCNDPSLRSAHHYHLIRSMRSGSWSYTGFRAPWNESRQTLKETFQSLGGPEWCSIRGVARPDGISPQSVEMFLYRCEIAVQYLRDERAKLAGIRIELWGAGHDQQKTCDFLGITRAELLWLDEQIRNVLKFPSRARKILPDEMICIRRKAKAGWARDVIRRWQRGYKQTYVSLFQQHNPSYEKPSPIYGGEEHVKGDDEDSTGTTAYSNGDEDALLSTVGLSGGPVKLISELHECIFDYLEIDWEPVDAWIMRAQDDRAGMSSQTAERRGVQQ